MEVVDSFNLILEEFKDFKNYNEIKIRDEKDILNIPLSTREDLQKFSMTKSPKKTQTVCTTSGSTGKNVFLFHSEEANKNVVKRILKTFDIMNLSSDDVALNLFEYGLSSSGRLLDAALCERGSSVIHFGVPRNEKWAVTIKAVDDLNPNILVATVSMIYELLNHSDCKSVRKIYTTGSLVTSAFIKTVKSKCDCEIYNLYGCNEVGPIAFGDAENEYLQVIEDGLYIEVLNKNEEVSRTGKGKIVITDFSNHSTPMIRYVLGDEVEIVEKDGEKLLRVLGRSDKFTNINCDVVSIGLLTKSVIDVLGHDKFFLVVDNENGQDTIEARIPSKDKEKIPEMSQKLVSSQNFYMSFKTFDRDYPATASGKYINYIDKRKLKLKDKKLNW